MFEVKFLRHNKEKHNSNVSQEYSFKKTFNTVTELMQYLDKASRLSVSVVNYSGLSHLNGMLFVKRGIKKFGVTDSNIRKNTLNFLGLTSILLLNTRKENSIIC